MSAPVKGPRGLTAFVPNGSNGYSRQDLAIVLIGAAREAELDDAKHVVAVSSGFYISDELAGLLYSEDEQEADADPEPEAEPEAAPKTPRKSSSKKKASGNRAAKNSTAEEE